MHTVRLTMALVLGAWACAGKDHAKDSATAGLATTTGDPSTTAGPASTGTGTGTGGPTTPPPVPRLVFTSGRAPTNLLMISIDTLRFDALDRLGGHGRMPWLSSLADSGFSVDDTRACAHWTFPTTACAIAGRSTVDLYEETGVLPQGAFHDVPMGTYPDGMPVLPTWLREAGFATLLITSNRVFGPERGHTDYDTVVVPDTQPADAVFDVALAELDAARSRGELDGPWYVHIHLQDPHRLYAPPPAYLDEVAALDPIAFDLDTHQGHNDASQAILDDTLSADDEALLIRHLTLRYEAEQRFLDDELALRWAELDAMGLLDDTLVVFWADHGEQLVEYELLGHGKSMYPVENRVMWFFWARDLVTGSTERPAAAIDIAPAVLDALGLPVPDVVTGLTLPELPETRTRLALGSSLTGPVAMATRGPWFVHWGLSDPSGRWSTAAEKMAGRFAYDLRADPDFTHPGWPEDPAVEALWLELEADVRRAEQGIEDWGVVIPWP